MIYVSPAGQIFIVEMIAKKIALKLAQNLVEPQRNIVINDLSDAYDNLMNEILSPAFDVARIQGADQTHFVNLIARSIDSMNIAAQIARNSTRS